MRTRNGVRILFTAALITTVVIMAPSPASAGEHHNDNTSTGLPSSPTAMAKPARMPISRHPGADAKSLVPATSCVNTSATRSVCVTPTKPSHRATAPSLAAIPFPVWCAESDGTPIAGSRTEACQLSGLLLTTVQTTNGTSTVTGELNMDVYDYTYSAVDLPNWAHQIGISPWSGWGAALSSTVTGTLSVAGDCLVNGASSFPVQSLSPANNALRTVSVKSNETF